MITVTVTPNQAPVAVNDPDGTPGGGNVITPTDPEAPGADLDPEGGNIFVTTAQHVVRDEGGNYVPAGDAVQIDANGEPIVGTYGTLTLLADGSYTFERMTRFGPSPRASRQSTRSNTRSATPSARQRRRS